jgi:hypothetical protein
MKRLLALGIALALTAMGCASPPRTGPETWPAPSSRDEASEREIAIWSATIRRLMMHDNTFGAGEVPFDRIYVLDRADPDAADMGNAKDDRKPKPISFDVQGGIQAELADLPPIAFVSSGNEVLADKDGCAHVRKNGALVTLGTIPDTDEKVEVEMGMFVACLAGTWLTYVVAHDNGEWRVTGRTGPIAIS